MKSIFAPIPIGIVLILFATMSRLPAQGPLAPPGAPGPTFKTLEQIESRTPIGPDTTPGDSNSFYVLSKPGSYYLTGNITGVATMNGIKITTESVTLDLNGFALHGVPSSLNGITYANVTIQGVTIRNGMIRDWGQSGVMVGGTKFGLNIQNVTSRNNGGDGFHLGEFAIVSHCIADGNTGIGFELGLGSYASQCLATVNDGGGFITSAGSLLDNCVARNNNGQFGISLNAGSLAHHCTVDFNIGANSVGIKLANGSEARDCVVRRSSGVGIEASINCTVRHCTVLDNTGAGIQATDNVLIDDNNVSQNDSHGIVAANNCFVKDNNVTSNGGDGIRVTGTRTRVDGNHVTGHVAVGAAGIRLVTNQGLRSLVVRNSCGGNTVEYSTPGGGTGNVAGPIISTSADADIDNPWGNFDLPEPP